MASLKKIISKIFKRVRGNVGTRYQRTLLKDWTPNGRYLEIGVWKGDFSSQIQTVCTPKELHLLDPWEFQPKFKNRMFGGAVAKDQSGMDAIFNYVKRRFAPFSNVHYHRGFSDSLFDRFDEGYFDAIYIDGNHYFEFVLNDLNNYWRKVKVGGLITGDDYYWTAADIKGQLPVKDAVGTFLNVHSDSVKFVKLVGDQFVLQRVI